MTSKAHAIAAWGTFGAHVARPLRAALVAGAEAQDMVAGRFPYEQLWKVQLQPQVTSILRTSSNHMY